MPWKALKTSRCRFKHLPFSLFWILLILTLAFTSCSQNTVNASPKEIVDSLAESMPETVMLSPASDRYLSAVFGADFPLGTEHFCLRNNTDGMDEIGVFKCQSAGDAAKLSQKINAALKTRYLAFDDRYFTEEKTKFEKATSLSYGRYVLYGILSDENLTSIKNNFNGIMKGTLL